MAIKMFQGIDYTKEDLVLVSRNWVKHYPCDPAKLSENHIECEMDYYPHGISITESKDGKYLSAKNYAVESGAFGRVKDYKIKVASGEPPRLSSAQSTRGICKDSEVRIYKDRKVAILRKFSFGNTTRYFVSKTRASVLWTPWNNITLAEFNAKIKSFGPKQAVVVRNDDEVEAAAAKITADMRGIVRDRFLPSYASDLSGRRIEYANCYAEFSFTQETQETIKRFFGLENGQEPSAEFAAALMETESKTGSSLSKTKSLIHFLSSNPKLKGSMEKKVMKADMLAKILGPEWEKNPSELPEEGVALWGRQDEWIACGLIGGVTCDYNDYGGMMKSERRLFGYNVKTKKKFFAAIRGDAWSILIPSVDAIRDKMGMDLSVRNSWTRANGLSTKVIKPRKTVIVGNLTLKELFSGTNIEWMLGDEEAMGCDIANHEARANRYLRDDLKENLPKIVKVRDRICESRLGKIALFVLMSSGVPMLELLLKSRLFNMYFAYLEAQESGGSLPFSEGDNYWDRIKVDQKAKNLKGMFGLPMNFLRSLDKAMVLEELDEYRAERRVPKIIGAAEALGCDLGSLDQDTIERVIALAIRKKGTWMDADWGTISCSLAESTPGMSPKLRVSMLEEFRGNFQEFGDYLRMRNRLKTLSESESELASLWNEDRYPVRPSAGRKFVRYVPDMPDMRRTLLGHSWYRGTMSEQEFREFVEVRYRTCHDRGDLALVRDESGRELLGCELTLTSNEMLTFLHDEISAIVSAYQDKAKAAEFEKAAKRIENLEWKDEETGLMVVTPKRMEEIAKEGSDLSHCVGSYINTIIENPRENIAFIRQIDHPDESYYTMELVGTEEQGFDVRQVHTYANKYADYESQDTAYEMTRREVFAKHFDVVKFLMKWATNKKVVNKKTIKDRYGALCHI